MKKWIFLSIIMMATLIPAIWAARYYTAEIRGIIVSEETIQSSPFRIPAYNYFFDKCASIQGVERALLAQKESLEFVQGDKKETNRIIANVAGLEAHRGRLIAEYNADAKKDYTIGQFRDSQLPYKISDSRFEGEMTKCES